MGVPFYGRSWTLQNPGLDTGIGASARGKGKAGKDTKSAGTLAYYECCRAYQQVRTIYNKS